MKIYGKLLILSLVCATAFADHSIYDQNSQTPMVAVRAVRLIDPMAQDSSVEPQLNFTDAKTSSVFTWENVSSVLKTLGHATWQSGASFTEEALEHHLGNSPLAKAATVFIQMPIGNQSYEEWATKMVANSAYKMGYINAEMAQNVSLSSILLVAMSEDSVSNISQVGLRIMAPQVGALLGEEIGWAVGKIAVQAPGYAKWLFDGEDLQSSDVVAAKALIEELLEGPTAPTAVSSMEEDPQAIGAQKVAAQISVDEDASMWGKTKTTVTRVWNKFTHSVKFGATQAIEAVRESLTWQNTKAYVSYKAKRLMGFSTVKTTTAVKATA
jgi:hypothetical protein